ncbi:MAG TPA: ABC transporter transmembrane domain-containing protein, partial [Anaerolineales bacterium]|nr:ABC transporter transmembrane domain-containing protein [Anaerolineales bacterium]
MTDNYEFEEEEFNTRFNGQIILRILAQAKPHWKMLAGFLLSISSVSVLDAVFTYISKRIIDEGILARDTETLYRLVTIYGGLIFVSAIGVFIFIALAGGLGERIQYDLRKKMFARLQDLSFSYYDRTPVGWIMSRVTSDSQRIAELVSWGILDTSWGIFGIGS